MLGRMDAHLPAAHGRTFLTVARLRRTVRRRAA